MNRRSFLEHVLASGVLAGGLPGVAQTAGGTANGEGELGSDGNGYAFWSNYFSELLPQANRSDFLHAKPTAKGAGVEQSRQINFLSYDATNKTLRFPQQVQNSELLDTPGDVTLSTTVGGIKLSKEDQDTFQNAGAAQMRVDLTQNEPMTRYFNISDKLAWASMAALFPTQLGKLPPLQDLSFDPSTTKDVLLPGGTGSVGVNVSMTKRESTLYKLMGGFVTEAGRFAPIMGLPAISVTALADIYKFYGYLETKPIFLFQTQAPVLAYTTQQARAAAKSSFGVNFVTGDYVLVPQKHVPIMQSRLTDFQVSQGYLIPKDADPSKGASVYDLAASADIPDISYVTMNFKIAPAFQNGSPAPTTAAGTVPAAAAAPSAKGKGSSPPK